MAGYFLGVLMKRVCVFIDGSNFYHNLKKASGTANVDFYKFGEKLTKRIRTEMSVDTELVRIYYYNAPVDRSVFPDIAKAQQRFLSALAHTKKLELHLGRLEKRDIICPECKEKANVVCPKCNKEQGNTYEEKEVDVSLAVDMIIKAANNDFDIGVLVSDDGDFASVLKGVKHFGKIAVFVGFGKTRALMNESDLNIFVSRKFFSDIRIKKK
jgi:uncharacterized LabA/DUF88 family protein